MSGRIARSPGASRAARDLRPGPRQAHLPCGAENVAVVAHRGPVGILLFDAHRAAQLAFDDDAWRCRGLVQDHAVERVAVVAQGGRNESPIKRIGVADRQGPRKLEHLRFGLIGELRRGAARGLDNNAVEITGAGREIEKIGHVLTVQKLVRGKHAPGAKRFPDIAFRKKPAGPISVDHTRKMEMMMTDFLPLIVGFPGRRRTFVATVAEAAATLDLNWPDPRDPAYLRAAELLGKAQAGVCQPRAAFEAYRIAAARQGLLMDNSRSSALEVLDFLAAESLVVPPQS